ncbi:MAG: VWA domain-containing protein [Terriglobia bacterium]
MKKIALCSLLLFAGLVITSHSSQEARKPADIEGTLKVSVDLVNVVFTVTEGNNRFVSNLNKEDFQVEEDGKPQEIGYFAKEVTLPLTLGLLIDTSPSVESILETEKTTAVEFLRAVLRKQDLALVMNFDRSVTLVQDFTADLRRLEKAIRSVSIGGGTSVHDAIYLASDEKLKAETGRKAIILISDGSDTTSKLKMKEALEAAQRADIIIFAISTPVIGPLMMGGGDSGVLKKYADSTGGRAFFPSKAQEFQKCFDAIQDELRSQYVLSYTSTNANKDGSFRSIKISVLNQKGLKVRAKKGYYAPKA